MRRFLLPVIVAAASALATAAWADVGSDFYKGKTVSLTIGFSPGDVYDIWARLIGKYISRHIPGRPNVIVQSMVGAGGLTAVNYIMNTAPKDGTVIAASSSLNPFSPLLGIKEALFDPREIQWLGSPTQDVAILLVWHTVPVSKFSDLKTHEIVLGSTSPDGLPSFYGRVIANIFKTKFRFVYGFPGLSDTDLAIERGEVDGHPSVFWNHLTAAKPEWLKNKQVKLLLQYGAKPRPEIPDVPYAQNLPMSEGDKQLFDAAMAPLELGYPYFMAPGVPANRVATLRKAISDTFKDHDFLNDARNQHLEVDPIAAETMAKIIDNAYAAPRPIIDRIRALYRQN